MLEEPGLLNDLFPLQDIEKFGFNHNSGFISLLQQKNHNFKKIKKAISCAQKITVFYKRRSDKENDLSKDQRTHIVALCD